MKIELVNKNNFKETSLDAFDRYQKVTNIFRLVDGNLIIAPNPFTETWSPERKREKAGEIMNGQFETYCAFDGEQVIGEIMLLPELNDGRLIIDSFHVSRPYRRQGIGRALFETAKAIGKARGARSLYLSACSAEETIRFYLALGFLPTQNPIKEYAEDEPFDIQMECKID